MRTGGGDMGQMSRQERARTTDQGTYGDAEATYPQGTGLP